MSLFYNSSTNLFLMPKSSTSKTKVDSGGMTGGWPRTPDYKHLINVYQGRLTITQLWWNSQLPLL